MKRLKKRRRKSATARMAGSGRALFGDATQRATEVVAKIREGRVRRGRLYIHHDVEPQNVEIERRTLPPVDLTRPAFESIANDCFSDLLRRRDSDSRMGEIVGGEEEHCVAGKDFSARFVDPKELATLRQSLRLRQRLRTAGVCSLFHSWRVAYTARRLRPFRRRRESTA